MLSPSGRTCSPTCRTRSWRTPPRRGRAVTSARPRTTLGTTDAVVIGLGAMIGAGVFSVSPRRRRPPGPACYRARAGRGRRVLQRGRLRAARGPVPHLRRDVRLRPRAAGGVVGICRGLGVRDRQDGVLRGDGPHVRRLRVPGLAGCSRAPRGRRPRRPSPRRTCAGSRERRAGAHPGGLSLVTLGRGPRHRCSAASVEPASPARGTCTAACTASAVGRPALLRVRRLRADRDARRGGPRSVGRSPAPSRSRSRSWSWSTWSSGGCARGRGTRTVAASPSPLATAVRSARAWAQPSFAPEPRSRALAPCSH